MKLNWWRFRNARSDAGIDPTVRALQSAAADAQRSRLPQMAAALSYRTLFGLLPIAIVGLILVRSFTTPETQAQVIRGAIEKFGLSSITVPSTSSTLSGGFVGPMPADLGSSQSLDEWVTAIILRADANVNFSAIGIIGLATLLYAAISMLVEIERAFNQIYRVPRGRSWFRRITNYWSLLTLGSGALVLTFYVGARFEHWVAGIVEDRGWVLGSGAITVGLIGYFVTVIISTALLMLAYMTVPNTRVKAVSAICGALVAALIWEAGKWGFAQYLEFSTNYARLYGSIALVPLFMLWVYVTWLIVLFGLQIAYQLQHGLKNTRAQPFLDAGPAVVDAAAALAVMSSVARAFNAGKQPTAAQIAAGATLPDPVAALVLGGLTDRGLVLRIDRPDVGEGESTYTLTRPPSLISAAEILEAGFAIASTPGSIDATTQRLRDAQLHAAGQQSLADLAALVPLTPPRLRAQPAGDALPRPSAPPKSGMTGAPHPQ